MLIQWFYDNSIRYDAFADDNELNSKIYLVIGVSNDSKAREIEYEQAS
jgi:hypothetical protein